MIPLGRSRLFFTQRLAVRPAGVLLMRRAVSDVAGRMSTRAALKPMESLCGPSPTGDFRRVDAVLVRVGTAGYLLVTELLLRMPADAL